MKNITFLLKLVFVLIAAGAVATFFLGTQFKIVCLIAVIFLAAVGIALLFSILSRYEDIIIKNEDDLSQCKGRLQASDELVARYRRALGQAEAKLDAEINNRNEVQSSNADNLMRHFKQNVSTPYFHMLSTIEMPVSDTDRALIIDKTIDMAMMALDMADAYDWTINNRPGQKINLERIAGELSNEDAVLRAELISDNPAVTPKWARAMKQSFASVLSEDSIIVYSGFKIK